MEAVVLALTADEIVIMWQYVRGDEELFRKLYSFMASVPANRIVQRAWKLDEATKLQAVAEMERLTGIAPNGAHAIKQAE
jgi:hypothetical protein